MVAEVGRDDPLAWRSETGHKETPHSIHSKRKERKKEEPPAIQLLLLTFGLDSTKMVVQRSDSNRVEDASTNQEITVDGGLREKENRQLKCGTKARNEG